MKTVILLAALACSAAAQQTWGGLRFGMKIAEAQEAVKDAKPVDSDPAVRVLEAPVAVRGHEGVARLIFEKESLVRVGLVFDLGKGKSCGGVSPDDVLAGERLQRDVRDALLEKYGKPVSERRSMLWKDAGQSIRLDTTAVCAGIVRLYVFYEPVGKDAI